MEGGEISQETITPNTQPANTEIDQAALQQLLHIVMRYEIPQNIEEAKKKFEAEKTIGSFGEEGLERLANELTTGNLPKNIFFDFAMTMAGPRNVPTLLDLFQNKKIFTVGFALVMLVQEEAQKPQEHQDTSLIETITEGMIKAYPPEADSPKERYMQNMISKAIAYHLPNKPQIRQKIPTLLSVSVADFLIQDVQELEKY